MTHMLGHRLAAEVDLSLHINKQKTDYFNDVFGHTLAKDYSIINKTAK